MTVDELAQTLRLKATGNARVVIFGGGTGLSNIIGGDSRAANWAEQPFHGLKEVFSHITSVVCITDDGGSTGELLKDLPLPAIGDVRHVMLSSVRLDALQQIYQATYSEARAITVALSRLFNLRFAQPPGGPNDLVAQSGADMRALPEPLRRYLLGLLGHLFSDARLYPVLNRPHCLGNLLLVAAIYRQLPSCGWDCPEESLWEALLVGLWEIAERIGAERGCVYPCTPTPALLRVRYANGIEITGEDKSSTARRGFPIERVFVDFCGHPYVYPQVYQAIAEADIILLAPGSLYSSIIPVFQVPGLAQAVRDNRRARKIFVANLWVQAGETDLSLADPERKFYVSDMIRAYERNIDGGTKDLFHEVLCLSLQAVPASVLQRYAVEDKVPIFLDKDVVRAQGYMPVERDIHSRRLLRERGMIQHDPLNLAEAVRDLYIERDSFTAAEAASQPHDRLQTGAARPAAGKSRYLSLPCRKYQRMAEIVAAWKYQGCGEARGKGQNRLRAALTDILWKHYDIAPAHLMAISGIVAHEAEAWPRDQRYDNIFSFYQPEDGHIHIRREQLDIPARLELAMLIAIGESLLGNYAAKKRMENILCDGQTVGKRYHLLLTPEKDRHCYFSGGELDNYLRLARMVPIETGRSYSRLLNGNEGFTPPGLLIGLTYSWYLENRLASDIEYKMSALRTPNTNLIPSHQQVIKRRSQLVEFFREVVFAGCQSRQIQARPPLTEMT
ncbi:MAG TPA: YvcK family protein [Desulfobulbaceae bacterium]|nr:YvcK family protein [Desulfobulbaceae bacterium]